MTAPIARQLRCRAISAVWFQINGASRQLQLSVTAGSSRIRLWEDRRKSDDVPDVATFYFDEGHGFYSMAYNGGVYSAVVYVEGASASTACRDVELQALYSRDGISFVDKVRLTIIDPGLKEVSFSGNAYHAVITDPGGEQSGEYAAPHWQDNSSPADGDADDEGDRMYPVCYTRNTKMKASVKIGLGEFACGLESLWIRGDGPGDLDFPETQGTLVNGLLVTEATECSESLPNECVRYDPFAITWQYSTDNRVSWSLVGISGNEVFVTLTNPQCETAFRTVLYLACQNGGTDAATCVSNTWAGFAGPANVCGWDECARDYTRKLHYYGSAGATATDAAGLLQHADGQCHSWAHLFRESLKANGVSGVYRVQVAPPIGCSGFGVKEIVFDDEDPLYLDDAPWKYHYEDDLNIAASEHIHGQNTEPPAEKVFGQHWIVYYGGTYYDASYGLTYSGEASFTSAAVEAWVIGDHAARAGDRELPPLAVRFESNLW